MYYRRMETHEVAKEVRQALTIVGAQCYVPGLRGVVSHPDFLNAVSKVIDGLQVRLISAYMETVVVDHDALVLHRAAVKDAEKVVEAYLKLKRERRDLWNVFAMMVAGLTLRQIVRRLPDRAGYSVREDLARGAKYLYDTGCFDGVKKVVDIAG